ncbi:MAG: RNA methyltransferase [Bacteroidales bacterium]|nr:RNA methyltransferase [Bacteroidales bacterium]
MEPADDLNPINTKELIAFLRPFVTAERFQKFQETLHFRTRHITIALEDIYQPHNASAVLRTCDCFGVQNVHIIENRNKYEVNPDVALGSSKWLDLFKYHGSSNNTITCIRALKKQGYRIVATTPHKDCFVPETLPLDRKTALIFGTELEGLTPVALEQADDYIKIPMVGFTESLNISVSAAIFIQTLTHRLRMSDIPWQLSEKEKDSILLHWLQQSIKKSELIIRGFLGHTE